MKTPALESLLNDIADLTRATLLKKRLQRRCFPGNKFKNIDFEEHLQIAASAGILLEFYN